MGGHEEGVKGVLGGCVQCACVRAGHGWCFNGTVCSRTLEVEAEMVDVTEDDRDCVHKGRGEWQKGEGHQRLELGINSIAPGLWAVRHAPE